jgi:hypothetical protein
MNLWIAEETVRALVQEVDPTWEQSLDPDQFEAQVTEWAMDLLESVQEVQAINPGGPTPWEEVQEVAQETAKAQMRERLRSERLKTATTPR